MLSCLALILMLSCTSRNKGESEVMKQHVSWVESLNDSLIQVITELENNTRMVAQLDSAIMGMTNDFEQTQNPKFVEQYLYKKGYAVYDVESNTGMIARITEDNHFELIATLKCGSFNQISVSDAKSVVESGVVNYDKALNYKIGSTNIVAFKDAKSDSIGRFITENEFANLRLKFINNSTSQTINLSAEQKSMISHTWKYFNAIRDKEILERKSLFLAEKAKIIETRINRD